MSTEHKRPLYAFAILALACALFVGNGMRSDAIRGVLQVEDRVVAIIEPPAEEKVATVRPPATAPAKLRMVSGKSIGTASATARSPRKVAKSKSKSKAASAKSAKVKVINAKVVRVVEAVQKAPAAKPSPRSNGRSSLRPGHRGLGADRGHAGNRGQGKARGNVRHTVKTLRGGTSPRQRGHRDHQHRPRAHSSHGKNAHRAQGHGKRQAPGHSRGGKHSGAKQQSQRSGRGGSASSRYSV